MPTSGSIQPGTLLGHYQVISKLGAGGMGEVYLAEDKRLERKVAVKVLPAEMARNEEQSARFLREAKVTSSLSHPHIAHVYDVGRHGDLLYLVMEYVEGRTLADRIRQGPLAAEEAATIALAVADALDEAHAKGIVHRDIKPGNVMLANRGQVKVLDFGLAKVAQPVPEGDETVLAMTTPGVVLGTVQYMSPEQALGKALDARSDIFALGATFYEMLAGKPPFSGGSVTETVEKILHAQPEALARLNYAVPEDLERIVRKCLEKDPGRRYQTAREIEVDLRNFLRDSASGSTVAAVVVRPAPWKRWIWALAAGALAVAAGFGVMWKLRQPEPPPKYTLTRITSDAGLATTPALSRDGKLLAYASDREGDNLDIWVRNISGGTTLRLTKDASDDLEPCFSPDASHVAFRSMRGGGGIYVVPAFGGDERMIAAHGKGPRYSPDGSRIALWTGETYSAQTMRAFIVPVTGGTPKQVAVELLWAGMPMWSPDGRKLLLVGGRKWPQGSLWVVNADGSGAPEPYPESSLPRSNKQAKSGTRARLSISFDVDGGYLYSSLQQGEAMNLFRMPISTGSMNPAGVFEQITSGTALERFPSVANGRIAFSSQSENVDVWFVSGDTNSGGDFSKPVRLTSDLAEDEFPAFAWKAGKVYYLSSRAGDSSLHELELGTQKTSAVAAAEGPKRRLLVTPDASRLVYSTARTLWTVRPGQPAEQVYKEPEAAEWTTPWGLSPNGEYVLLGSRLRGEGKLELLDLGTGRARKLLESWTSQATFSPDGRHFVVLREQAISIFPVNDAPLDPSRDAIMVAKASAGQDLPRWSPDGKRIYFLSSRDGFRCVWMQRLNPATLRPEGEPESALHIHGSRVSLMHVPDIGAVGLSVGPQGIVYSAGEATGNIWLATPQEER